MLAAARARCSAITASTRSPCCAASTPPAGCPSCRRPTWCCSSTASARCGTDFEELEDSRSSTCCSAAAASASTSSLAHDPLERAADGPPAADRHPARAASSTTRPIRRSAASWPRRCAPTQPGRAAHRGQPVRPGRAAGAGRHRRRAIGEALEALARARRGQLAGPGGRADPAAARGLLARGAARRARRARRGAARPAPGHHGAGPARPRRRATSTCSCSATPGAARRRCCAASCRGLLERLHRRRAGDRGDGLARRRRRRGAGRVPRRPRHAARSQARELSPSIADRAGEAAAHRRADRRSSAE